MDTIAQLGRLAAMTKYAEGEGLMASLKDFAANNPTAFGAAGGGLLGAGAGYLLGDKEDRLRAALAGAGIVAGIGGVGGYAAGNRMAGEKGLEALQASTDQGLRDAAIERLRASQERMDILLETMKRPL